MKIQKDINNFKGDEMIDLRHLKGKFITFEGGEGSGKTIFSDYLFEDFKDQKIPVVKTHDPGGTKCAAEIRKIVLGATSEVCDMAEMLLFAAARAQLVVEIILPAMMKGKTVICDRWYDSTVVYQGICKNQDLSMIHKIFEYSCGLIPDITFLMNVDADIGLERSYRTLTKDNVDESRFENYGLIFHKKVNKAFLDLACANYNYPPNDHLSRIKIINANKTTTHCYEEIKNHLENYK